MIMKSKQIKYERQKERDKTLDLTEQLDKEWRNILPLIGNMAHKAKQEHNDKESNEHFKPDEFDVLVKSLQFDSKAKVFFVLFLFTKSVLKIIFQIIKAD
jgi:nucleolar protein 14